MKIAISAACPNLNAKIGHKFGTSQYLVTVDVESRAEVSIDRTFELVFSLAI